MQIMINPICNIKKIGASESKKLSNKFLLDVEILVLGKKYLYSVFNKRTKLAITEKAIKYQMKNSIRNIWIFIVFIN